MKCYVSSASEDFVSFSILDPETLSSELPSEQLSSELSHQRTVFIRLWERWCIHGPKGARFNRTHSGWFESYTFLDWLMTVFLPAAKKQTGPKVQIGDNLSSHLNEDIVSACERNNIRFVFLPPNSTHLTQPLNVAFFHPLKLAWRKVLCDYKSKQITGAGTITKDEFLAFLKKWEDQVGFSNSKNLQQAFQTYGIFQLDVVQNCNKMLIL